MTEEKTKAERERQMKEELESLCPKIHEDIKAIFADFDKRVKEYESTLPKHYKVEYSKPEYTLVVRVDKI